LASSSGEGLDVILVDLLVSAVQHFWVLYGGALFILIGFAIAGAFT
jgi:hypothetical protein